MRLSWVFAALMIVVPACTARQVYDADDVDAGNADVPEVGVPATGLVPPDGGVAECGDRQTDPKNCGACGHDCQGGACVTGLCAPVVLASTTGAEGLRVTGAHAYWVERKTGEVQRVPVGGGKAVTIAEGLHSLKFVETALDRDDLYVAATESDVMKTGIIARVWRVNLKDGSKALIGTRRSGLPLENASVEDYTLGVRSLQVLNGDVYWIARGISERTINNRPVQTVVSNVYSCPVTGCAGVPSVVVRGGSDSSPSSLAVARGHLLISDFEKNRTYALNSHGQFGLFDALLPTFIHTDDQSLYVLSSNPSFGRMLFRCRLSDGPCGNPVDMVGSGVLFRDDFTLDDQSVYWPVDWNGVDPSKGPGSIRRCPKDGRCADNPEIVADGQSEPHDVAVDATAIYWATSDRIMKLAKPASPTAPR